MAEPTIKEKAQQLADGLGISIWVRPDGTCHQRGPGEEYRPYPGARPAPHGEPPDGKDKSG